MGDAGTTGTDWPVVVIVGIAHAILTGAVAAATSLIRDLGAAHHDAGADHDACRFSPTTETDLPREQWGELASIRPQGGKVK